MASFTGDVNEWLNKNYAGAYNYGNSTWNDAKLGTTPYEKESKKIEICQAFIGSIGDPMQFANDPSRSAADKKLIYRCLARLMRMRENCDEQTINIAFAAMNMSEEDIIIGLESTMGASANGGGALYQVGGAFGADVALALLFQLVNTPILNATLLNAALKAPAAFTYALNWAAGKADTISDCLKSFLGIGAGADAAVNESYYAILTNKIAGIYYQGVGSIDAYKVAIKTWLEANPMDALGFTAVVMRYPRIIINITVATIRTLSSITFQTVEVAFAAASTIWASDSGVFLCVLLYFYNKYGEQLKGMVADMSGPAKDKFNAGIIKLAMFERAILSSIDDRAATDQLDSLIKQLAERKAEHLNSPLAQKKARTKKTVEQNVGLATELTVNAGILDAETAEMTKLTNLVIDSLAALAQANITHAQALALNTQINAEYDAAMVSAEFGPPIAPLGATGATGATGAMAPLGAMAPTGATGATDTTDAMAPLGATDPTKPGKRVREEQKEREGGKSRSRKSHKKISKSKRPKKSVRSRKAKGAKRSNKKH